MRFPNSGIRAKRRQRGGEVASHGRPPTARPRPRAPTRGRPAAARASPQGRPVQLAGAAARKGTYRHSRLRPARMGGSHPWDTLLQCGAR
ncbi:hypothetical protein BHM03_00055039 [Ensete ventricosum]|nr:hypothetical protein BHM03_00055039 [Ensete ventricosum]